MNNKVLDIHAIPVRPDGEYLAFHRARRDWLSQKEAKDISERRYSKNWEEAWVFNGRNLIFSENPFHDIVPIGDAVEIENRDKIARGLEG